MRKKENLRELSYICLLSKNTFLNSDKEDPCHAFLPISVEKEKKVQSPL